MKRPHGWIRCLRAVRISPEQEQLLGLKFAVARSGAISESMRAVARVGLDETRVAHVQTKLDGYVDQILVRTVGTEVRRGQVVSFLPVLALEAEEGKLFRPLAYTKTLAMVVAAILAITLDPALRLWLTRMKPVRLRPERFERLVNLMLVGTIHSEERHPISRFLMRCYHPVAAWALRSRWMVLAGAAMLIAVTIPVYQRIGSEFMPPLDEGSLSTCPRHCRAFRSPKRADCCRHRVAC
jgi:Cu/Ag efflux pump CusA